ncbi:MAG: acyl-homoserine-lactone synthase [Pseudomonadota bacterium]
MNLTILPPELATVRGHDMVDYHRLRHDIFVALSGLGRQDLYSAAGWETDIWDLSFFKPVHFLVRDETGAAVAVGRMTSSSFPTMMETHYPEFVDGPCPKQETLWEVQRLGVRLDLPKWERERALLTLLTGMLRWCQDAGVEQVMLLTFEGIYRKRLTKMRPMGPVGTHLNFPHIALINEIQEEAILEIEEQLHALQVVEQKVA